MTGWAVEIVYPPVRRETEFVITTHRHILGCHSDTLTPKELWARAKRDDPIWSVENRPHFRRIEAPKSAPSVRNPGLTFYTRPLDAA
jgi:hypothetical protein